MLKAKPNYTKEEYSTLIKAADCIADLELIEGLLKDDQKNRAIEAFDYIDVRCLMTVKLTSLTIEGCEDMLGL